MACAGARRSARAAVRSSSRTNPRRWCGGCRAPSPARGSPTACCRSRSSATKSSAASGRRPLHDNGPGGRMTDQDYDAVRRLLHARCAVALDDGKQSLVESGLAPILRQRKLESIGDLVAQLQLERNGDLERQIVEALVTTESSFFRDLHPFESLRNVVLPDLIHRRR